VALKYWLGCRQPDREPLEIHVTVSKPVSDEGQEGCGKFESLDTDRFAGSGHKSGYIFELCFILANNPSILDFFVFQYDS